MAAPTFVGAGTKVNGSTGTLTPTAHASTANNDVVIAQIVTRGTTDTLTAPTGEGWAVVPGSTLLQSGSLGSSQLFYKVWGQGNTDDTTPTFTRGGTLQWAIQLYTFRGTSLTAPVYAYAEAGKADGTTTSYITPSVSYTSISDVTYARFAAYGSGSGTFTAASGHTLCATQNSGNNLTWGAEYLTTSGASTSSGTATLTGSVSNSTGWLQTIVLQPPGIARTLIAKAASSSNTKATILKSSKLIVAKAASAHSAKATILQRSKTISAKAATANATKATILQRSKLIVAKSATATSSRVVSLQRNRTMAGKVGSSTGSKATLLRRAKSVAAKVGTSSAAKASLTVNTATLFTAKSGNATKAKATVSVARPFVVKAATGSSARSLRLNRTQSFSAKAATGSSARSLRLSRAQGFSAKAPVGSGAKALRAIEVKRLTSKAASSISAKGSLTTAAVSKMFTAKVATAAKAKAQPQVAFQGPGFLVIRSLKGRLPIISNGKADLDVATESFLIRRALQAKVSASTSAYATPVVSYLASGGFDVKRSLLAKLRTAVYARGEIGTIVEGFTVLRPLAAKARITSSAKAALSIKETKRKLTAKAATPVGAKASLRTVRIIGAKAALTANARSTILGKAPKFTVKAAVAASMQPVPLRRATRLQARSAIATSGITPYFKISKNIEAHAATSTEVNSLLSTLRQLQAQAATSTRARASLTRTLPITSWSAQFNTTAWAKATRLNKKESLVVKLRQAADALAELTVYRDVHVRLATATAAKASLTRTLPNFVLFSGTASLTNSASATLRVGGFISPVFFEATVPTSTGSTATPCRFVSMRGTVATSSAAKCPRLNRRLQLKAYAPTAMSAQYNIVRLHFFHYHCALVRGTRSQLQRPQHGGSGLQHAHGVSLRA